ncbi:oligoribonuclease [Escherichia coli]|uniref:Oligoribonuclease n=7 Tax=Gammaproteobacteria TaxID=1236 RepID=A0A2X3M6H7_ECOLX|nr:oligoribonuclease [Escherichia coli]
MAGNHQYAITDIAVDIHLLVDERHAFVVQQVYLVEHNNRLNLQGFAGHQVTVDNIERQLRQNGGDNDNLVDVGGNRFYAVVEIRTRQHRGTLMHRFHDPFDIYAFRRRFTRTPDYAVAGYQRTDGTANIAAVNVAIGGFHISVHTKAADDDTFIRLAKQIVVVVGLLLRRFKTDAGDWRSRGAAGLWRVYFYSIVQTPGSPLMGKTSMIHAIVDQYSHCEWVENSMSANENNLIWIDLEMTGLDPERDRIIEIATLVTDANLNILAEGPTIAVHQSDEQLALMDDWNVRTHTASGLVERVKAEHDGRSGKLNWQRSNF